jgi:general secretion pathway protein N
MDGQQFDGDVCIAGLNSFFVKNVTAIFPATLLKPMLPLAIDGQVSLAIQQASIANAKLASVQARAGWMGARVHNGTNWMSLGGLSADVTDDGKGGLTAHVVDVGSPFHVDLVASLLVPAGGNVKGNLVMTEAYATEINAGAWLSMFATESPRDAQGNLVYALDVNL